MHRLFVVLLLVWSLPSVQGAFLQQSVPAEIGDDPVYAEWAHYHWVWLNHGAQSRDTLRALVDGYKEYGIPVGALNIDSEWSTSENDFLFDTKKFPNASAMVEQYHSEGIRVILWATSVMNTNSPSYKEGCDQNFYLNHCKTIKWWHGVGSLLDYSNENAVNWWHGLMDNVLDIGIDGFKCDGTDPYIFELIWAEGEHGHVTYREYADAYYRDFFYYSRQRRGPQALIMSRPVDCFPPGTGLTHFALSPRDVVFSGWVGDQDPTFFGLRVALTNMLDSARHNYVGYGSDTGGYRSGEVRTKELFIRWSQLSTFTTLFENGGEGEHRPWMFDEETVEIYRDFVNIHYSLAPFFYSAGNEVYRLGTSVMEPQPLTSNFKMYHDIFVSPIIENVTELDILFPGDGPWVDWWNHSLVYDDYKIVRYQAPLSRYPAFRRQGSIIPLYGNGHRFAEERSFYRRVASLMPLPKPEPPKYHVVDNFQSHSTLIISIVRPVSIGGKFRVQDGFDAGCSEKGFGIRYFADFSSTNTWIVEASSHCQRDAVIEISGVVPASSLARISVVDELENREVILSQKHESAASLLTYENGVGVYDLELRSLYISPPLPRSLTRGLRYRIQNIVLS